MKILHFSTWQTGGAAKAAARLSHALRTRRYESEVIHMSSRFPAYLDAALGKLAFDPNPIFHSYNFFPDNFKHLIQQKKPDLVHLHWVGAGFVRPESLIACPVPLVWTLHDLWPLLGAEHLPKPVGSRLELRRLRDGYLPTNRPAAERGLDLNRLVWNRKRRLLQSTHLHFIAPSRSLYLLAQQARLSRHASLSHIPNFVDRGIYHPAPKLLHPTTVLYSAMSANLDPNKGLDLLFRALSVLPPRVKATLRLRLAGLTHLPAHLHGADFNIELMGVISNESKMAKLYQESSLVVIPSYLENLPYVAMESLACGTPVVAFKVGGLPELVIHNQTGILAAPYDVFALAAGIVKILTNSQFRAKLSANALAHLTTNFAESMVLDRHLALYNSLLNR